MSSMHEGVGIRSLVPGGNANEPTNGLVSSWVWLLPDADLSVMSFERLFK